MFNESFDQPKEEFFTFKTQRKNLKFCPIMLLNLLALEHYLDHNAKEEQDYEILITILVISNACFATSTGMGSIEVMN